MSSGCLSSPTVEISALLFFFFSLLSVAIETFVMGRVAIISSSLWFFLLALLLGCTYKVREFKVIAR